MRGDSWARRFAALRDRWLPISGGAGSCRALTSFRLCVTVWVVGELIRLVS